MGALFQTLGSDPRDDRDQIRLRKGARVEGTCACITSHETYRLWLGSHSQLLYLSGGPGTGKTMLSVFLMEEIARLTAKSSDAILLEVFCDNKDEKRRTTDGILRGLIFQLLQLRPILFAQILPIFGIQKESLFSASSTESLWKVFKKNDSRVSNWNYLLCLRWTR